MKGCWSGQRKDIRSAFERVPEALEHGKGDPRAFGFLDDVELLWISDRQQTQHHCIEQAEDSRVEPNAEREHQYDDCRERRVAPDDPHRVADILDESLAFNAETIRSEVPCR
jgi:hypothetical protein